MSLIYGDLNDVDDEPGTAFTMSELRESILATPSYGGGPIRLIACTAGKSPNGLAQRLADVMGVDVLAPTQTVFINERGDLVLANSDEEYTQIVAGIIKSTGEWLVFKPRSTDG